MNVTEAKELKTGQMIYHTTKKNVDGSPMRARVTSIKTWKRDPARVEVRVKRGLYDYACFDQNELHYITTEGE
jgi:hypothetical protein